MNRREGDEEEDRADCWENRDSGSTQMCQTPWGQCLDPECCSDCPYYQGDKQ